MKLSGHQNAVASFSVFLLCLSSCAAIAPFQTLDEIAATIADLSPAVIALDGIQIQTQPTSSTCGITTATIMSNFFNDPDKTIEDLMTTYGVDADSGTSQAQLKTWLAGEMPGYTIESRENEAADTMLRSMHASLAAGYPVAVFFGAPNPFNAPWYDFHASVVYGMDLDAQTVSISNAYGYSEGITLIDFLNRMAFTEPEKYPGTQQFIITWGLIPKNMYFLVTQGP